MNQHPRWLYAALIALALGLSAWASAAGLRDIESIPQLPSAGADDYRQFLSGTRHRAFAIAPGGAWGWKADADTEELAGDAALDACRDTTRQTCVLYAVDDKIVFDRRAWPTLWGPYDDAAKAGKAATGRQRGERFPDLAFSDAGGKPFTATALRGKVTLLHFWGSWCKPCRQEMPQLQALREALRGRDDIAFVLLQAREPFAVSRRWAEEQQSIRLPLFDSGSRGEDDAQFALAGGGRIKDRDVAAVFPTTYVLDKRGIVVFSHVGPVHDWPQYAPFLVDAARRSGR